MGASLEGGNNAFLSKVFICHINIQYILGFGRPEGSSSSLASPFWAYDYDSASLTTTVLEGHCSDGLIP